MLSRPVRIAAVAAVIAAFAPITAADAGVRAGTDSTAAHAKRHKHRQFLQTHCAIRATARR